MTDTGAAARSTPLTTTNRRRTLCASLLLALMLLLPTAVAQGDTTAQDAAPDVAGEAAEQTALVGTDDPVLIQLGSYVERLSDFEWRFDVAVRGYLAGQGVPYSPEMAAQLRSLMPSYLAQRTSEVVLLREAERRQLLADQDAIDATLERIKGTLAEGEDYDEALAAAGFASEQHLVTLIRESDLITQVVDAIAAEIEPSDEQVRVRFHADRDRFTQAESFCARHILVADRELAESIVADVQGGADFAALAGEHGTDATSTRGGDLGCFGRGQMVAPFEEAVVAATVGEVAGPIETQFGYHAILVYDHVPSQVLPFADVEAEVRESVRGTLVDAHIGGLLRGAGVASFPERLPAQ